MGIGDILPSDGLTCRPGRGEGGGGGGGAKESGISSGHLDLWFAYTFTFLRGLIFQACPFDV